MGSTIVYKDDDTFDDGSRYEMIATDVPKSNDYPEGIKYRFQYMAEDGRTLLRFDNFPDHPRVDRHHYHTPDGVYDDIEYTDLKAHVRKFHTEMETVVSGDLSCPTNPTPTRPTTLTMPTAPTPAMRRS